MSQRQTSNLEQTDLEHAAAGVGVRRCALAVFACWLGFVLLIALAMWLYPGGNWLDRHAPGHRFFANFLCDLTQPVSLSGVDNRLGASLAQVGMLCFAAALAAFFWILPQHFRPGVRTSRWVRALGECAVIGVVAVPLTPSEHFGRIHGALALAAGGLGILAALIAVFTLSRSHSKARWLGRLGALALAVGGFDAILFAYHFNDAAPPPLLLPAAQKVAALLLSAWMLGAAGSLLARPDPRFVTHRP